MNIAITGTSSGIGQNLTRFLGSAGHRIWGLARRPQEELLGECRARGIDFTYSQGDIAQWDSLQTWSRTVETAWQGLDALICCAGIQGPIRNAMQIDPQEWARSVQINLTGTFFTLRACYPLLARASRRAKIICFSGGGSTGPRINFTPYASAKAGVVRLVETLAHEWDRQPIDINAIAPGAVNTRMTEEVLRLGPDIVGIKEFNVASRQMKEGGTPLETYAQCVQFLLSPQSDGISGRLISALWDPWKTLGQHTDELKGTDIFTLRRIVPKERNKSWE